jgi:hypothetical protein
LLESPVGIFYRGLTRHPGAIPAEQEITMKLSKLMAVSFLVSFAGAAFAQHEPPVAVKTGGMPTHVAAKVKEKAAEGTTALRRYVNSTRMVNQLDFRSIIQE